MCAEPEGQGEIGLLLAQAFEASGIPFALYEKEKEGHHPHGLADPAPLADFLEAHTR